MNDNFDAAFEKIIGSEGGYVNDPQDPGGETKFGISKRSYPTTDIANLTLDQAKAIYQRDYWDKCSCSQLPSPLDLLVFDSAVNQGVSPACHMLQDAVGVVSDGVIGALTVSAAVHAGPRAAALFMANRAMRYANTPEPQRTQYLHGWFNRLFLTSMGV